MTEDPQGQPDGPAPGDAAPPASAAPQAPPPAQGPEPRRPRRLAVKVLIGLYALSLAAAGVLLVRPAAEPGAKRSPGLSLPDGFLSSPQKEYVGVVEINGTIYDQDGGGVWSRGVDAWGRKIESLAKNDAVKAIVLSINSPGGSVGSVQELHSLLERVRTQYHKPVVAQLGDVAASGGFYLAVSCDQIVAHPGSLVGSIGVIFETMNVQGLMEKLGIKSTPIKSGKMKDIGSMTRPMTKEERDLLQGLIMNAYGQFVAAVAEGRHLPKDKVLALADGRIFTGEQAKKLGLVDQLGDSYDAVQLAGKLGHIAGKPQVLREGETLSGLLQLMSSRLSFDKGVTSLLGPLGALAPTGLEYRWRP